MPTLQANHDYIPPSFLHSHDSMLHHEYGLDASCVRLWCVLHVFCVGERWLSNGEAVRESLITASRTKTELWSHVSHTVYSSSPPVPPMCARHFVILELDTVCVWYHPKALCSTKHMSMQKRWKECDTRSEPFAIEHVCHDITDMFLGCDQ